MKKHLLKRTLLLYWTVSFFLLPFQSFCQEEKKIIPDGTEGQVHEEIDTASGKKVKKNWNTYNLGFTTLVIGAGALIDYAAYSQDEEGKKQMDSANVELKPGFDIRDSRIVASGKLNTKRNITWKAGFMYDGENDDWFLRETGIMVAVPELWGHFFIGRTKEGFSQSKVQLGYAGEIIERHVALDPIPILADGVKWLGFLPRQRIFWNIGVFTDWISKNESFSTYSSQFIARIGCLPVFSEATKTNLHVAVNIRMAHPEDDKTRVRSRPEAGNGPYFMDSGEFPTTKSTHLGGEVYYKNGPWLFGSEFVWHKFDSPEKGNPVFSGGELVASYMFTGESHPYNSLSNSYGFVEVERPVFKGGPGAWELVLRFSTYEVNGGLIQGGEFRRITPQVNWYLNKHLRLHLVYGYGILDRFNRKGSTQFFQSRLMIYL